MKKVVLDTNILVSAIVFGGKPRKIVESISRGKIKGYISKFIISELRIILRQKFGFEEEMLDRVEELIEKDFILIEPRNRFEGITKCEADNRIVECALEAKVDYLVSGDKKHILPLKKVGKIKIVGKIEEVEKRDCNLLQYVIS